MAVGNVVGVADCSTAVVVGERRYVDVDKAVRLCRLDGAQGDSVVGCEDGGVYGDPDGQCQYRHGGEAGVLQQLAEGEFEIIHIAMPPSDLLLLRVARESGRRGVRRPAGPAPSPRT